MLLTFASTEAPICIRIFMVSTRLLFLSRSSWTSGEWGGWQFCSSCSTALWARTAQCNAVKPEHQKERRKKKLSLIITMNKCKTEVLAGCLFQRLDKGASTPIKPRDGSIFVGDTDWSQAAWDLDHQHQSEVAAYCELSASRWWKNQHLTYFCTNYTLERAVSWKKNPNRTALYCQILASVSTDTMLVLQCFKQWPITTYTLHTKHSNHM